ncbi:MAG: phage baseplate assembly protein V [Candidatus Solibacter sp.]
MPASYLKIGGELLEDAILSSVEVEEELNRHSWCRIICRQTPDRRFPFENFLGKALEVVTFDQQGSANKLFTGFVLESEMEYEIYGSYSAHILGVTESYKLSISAGEAYYRKHTLPDVASEIGARSSVTVDVQATARAPKNYVQWGESDFDFLVRLADDHQAWIRPTAAGVQICDAFRDGAKVQWRADDGQGLTQFEVTGRVGQPSFGGTHYDARKMQSKTLRAVRKRPESFGSSPAMTAAVEKQSGACLPEGFVHVDGRAASEAEFRELLERESVRSVGSATICRGQSRNEQVKPGNTVEISGVLDARGTYGVTRVVHRWTKQGYTNEFWCTPWKNYVSPSAPAARRMRGVVSARVVDQNDPRKMGRLKIQYDWQEQGETGWARMATPHAGGDRGFLFLPEKGDEVLVAFENGNPERPIVLGSLWNGVDKAPRAEFWGGDIESNDVKRIVTKSGHRIQLSDKEGKESLVVSTPTKLKIALLEKADETGRPMLLLHSEDGDIFVSAPNGRIHVQGKFFSREVGG